MRMLLGLSLAMALVATAQQSSDPSTTPIFQYASPFNCGAAVAPTEAAPGRYFTTVSVHNAPRAGVLPVFTRILVLPESPRGSDAMPYTSLSIPSEGAIHITCADIIARAGSSSTVFTRGYVLLETARELDVDTVTTAGAGQPNSVVSVHAQRIQPRRLSACSNLDLAIGTRAGSTWMVVTAPIGQVPRTPDVLSSLPAPAGSALISGVPGGKTSGAGSIWEYETCFCLCPGFQNVTLNIKSATADDDGQFFLNGTLIGTVSGFTPPAASIAALNTNANGKFRVGRNCLRARITDTKGGGTSVSMSGSISGTAANCP
ncbi:MAG: hypothetical protein QOJ98_3544 [Acidobacteriota bacterium]|nr:hypothetical protein [Acidobacteriota bacterium]